LFAEKILHAKRSMQIIEIRYLWPRCNDFAIKNYAGFIYKKNDHCRFWHNGFATHWNTSLQCDLVNETNKVVFLTVAMLLLISLCVIAASDYSTGFDCYSTWRLWVYAKCTSG